MLGSGVVGLGIPSGYLVWVIALDSLFRQSAWIVELAWIVSLANQLGWFAWLLFLTNYLTSIPTELFLANRYSFTQKSPLLTTSRGLFQIANQFSFTKTVTPADFRFFSPLPPFKGCISP